MKRFARLGLLLLAACATAASSRYEMARDLGSRYGFRYLRDTVTGQWVNRECELRVSEERKLPVPLTDPEHGDQMHVQRFDRQSVGSAGMDDLMFERRDGYRIWQIADVMREDDLDGRVAYGVQLPDEPLEIIRLPPPGNTPPGQWSEWMRATDLRAGPFGWWEEAQGRPVEPVAPPDHPFELRCRMFLSDVPGFIP